MKKLIYFVKSVVLFIWLLGIIYALFYNTQMANAYGFSIYIVPILAVLSISLITYRFIGLLIRSDEIENEFTTIVNHIFRTPLTRILWISNELKTSESYTERQAQVTDIENATNRLLGIVDTIFGIKDIHNQSSYVFKAVSIREIVETSLLKHSVAIKQKNIKMDISIFNEMPLLTADLKKISFVMDVLIENAIIYTPNNGGIIVDCQVINNKIVFYVADSGIGITFFEKLRMFSKFYRSKRAVSINPDGMGLGLYLARAIIKRHGGKIYAKSKGSNAGATFFIELPLNR